MLIEDLDPDENTFITITPAGEDPIWYASITLLADGSYEVERADPARVKHPRKSMR